MAQLVYVNGKAAEFQSKTHIGSGRAVAGYRDSFVWVTRKMVIFRVKMGKNFTKNQSKAHIPNDKIEKK